MIHKIWGECKHILIEPINKLKSSDRKMALAKISKDNGPENSSHRTQYIKRITQFSAKYNVKVILAYYPPYHSKYNPVERIWGCLEQHWNEDIPFYGYSN